VRRHPCSSLQILAHQREDDCFKVGTGGRVGKDSLGKRGAVNPAIVCEDAPPEASDDGIDCRPAGSFKFMDNVVCVDKPNAKLP